MRVAGPPTKPELPHSTTLVKYLFHQMLSLQGWQKVGEMLLLDSARTGRYRISRLPR